MIKKTFSVVMASLILASVPAVNTPCAAQSAQSLEIVSYDKYQDLTYTGALGETLRIRAYATTDDSELLLMFNFYDDNASVKVVRQEDGKYQVVDGGFFATDGKAVAELAVKNGRWIRL